MTRFAVIGRGLIGSAAARHLAKAGHDVTLVGPAEPETAHTHTGVFGSHYDEGRITRRMATHPFWARVSAASIDRYAEIAREGGIDFFAEVGAMMAGAASSDFMRDAIATGAQTRTPHETLDPATLAARFPFFAFPGDFAATYEPTGAGHISPRRLVAAQTAAARAHGASLIDAAVTGIAETAGEVRLRTAAGSHGFDRVLVATGGMTDHVLPVPLKLTVKARTVTFFRVDAVEAARLAGMPSLVFRWDALSEPYLLPPIRYPDGGIYLKLGGEPVDRYLTTAGEIGDWFRSAGSTEAAGYQRQLMSRLMPDLRATGTHTQSCMTTYTRSGLPVIDRLSERIAVATAGNGQGAKCSDELGRLGAEALIGTPPEGLSIAKEEEGEAV